VFPLTLTQVGVAGPLTFDCATAGGLCAIPMKEGHLQLFHYTNRQQFMKHQKTDKGQARITLLCMSTNFHQ
jgi:hypothetical protein